MSDQVALSRVDIRGFRTLCEPLSIEFGPGVTILVGPNGSGKSTVLDGIEWALTRQASRLPILRGAHSRAAPDVFKTLGSDDTPEVVLHFVDIGDGSRHHLRGGDDSDRVGAFLRRGEAPWRDFKAAEAALRWTHFSSQRSTARLGYESDEVVLKTFAGPAGLESHQGLDRRLWGTETRGALRELVHEAEERIRKHEVALAYVDRLLAAQEAPAPEPDSGPGNRVAALLATLIGDLGLQIAEAGNDLERLERLLVDERAALEQRLARLNAIIAERRDVSIRARRLAADRETARDAFDTATALQGRRVEAKMLAQAGVRQAQEAVAECQEAITALRANAEKRERLATLSGHAERLGGAVSEARMRAAAASERLDLLGQLERADARVRAGLALIELQRARAAADDFGDAPSIRATATRMVAELSERLEQLTARRRDAEATIANERERLQTVAALSNALASHLRQQDTACPVCAANYDVGELLKRAQAASIDAGPASERIAMEINEITQELGRVTGQLEFAQARRDEAETVIAAQRRQAAEIERQASIFAAPWSTELQEALESEVADLRSRLGVRQDNEPAGLRLGLEERQRYYDRAAEETQAEFDALVGERRALAAELGDAPEDKSVRNRIAILEAQLNRSNAQLATAQDDLRFATELSDAADAQLRRAEEAVTPIAESFQEEQARLVGLDGQLASMLDGERQEIFGQAVSERVVRLGGALDQLRAIRSEEELRRHANASDPDLLLLRANYLPADSGASDTELRETIAAALAEAQESVAEVEALGRRLSDRARLRRQIDMRLQGSALEPWNSLFRAVYTSLAGALGETLEWTTSRADMRFSELNARPTPHIGGKPIYGWMAAHFFSEGQLAALQIAAMITASVLLPWSRWQALLLDDPLQHADVIKVGAFADLMRGLCQDLGHQIILTTHDAVQAEFLAAKFRAANLPANIVRFERLTALRPDLER